MFKTQIQKIKNIIDIRFDDIEVKSLLLMWCVLSMILFSSALFLINYQIEKETSALNFKYDFKNEAIEKKVLEMASGYPIEKMAPYIAEKDSLTAAFLVSIAKKESNWGKKSPKMDGQECYNYWGYRGQGDRVTNSGYTCFSSEKEAVNIVGRRIRELARGQELNTPSKMIVWKCGSTCAGHGDYSVYKWISDVDVYFDRFYNNETS